MVLNVAERLKGNEKKVIAFWNYKFITTEIEEAFYLNIREA